MKKILFPVLLILGIAAPAQAELNVTPGVIPEAIQQQYENPVDQEIAIATYEMLSDAPRGLNRLERTLASADDSRRIQIESLLFLNYVHFASPAQPKQSMEWLTRAAELKPDDPRPYRQLREVYCIRSKFEECKDAHRNAVARSEDETVELTRLATLLQGMGRIRDASTVLKAAIEAESEKASPDPSEIERLRRWYKRLARSRS